MHMNSFCWQLPWSQWLSCLISRKLYKNLQCFSVFFLKSHIRNTDLRDQQSRMYDMSYPIQHFWLVGWPQCWQELKEAEVSYWDCAGSVSSKLSKVRWLTNIYDTVSRGGWLQPVVFCVWSLELYLNWKFIRKILYNFIYSLIQNCDVSARWSSILCSVWVDAVVWYLETYFIFNGIFGLVI